MSPERYLSIFQRRLSRRMSRIPLLVEYAGSLIILLGIGALLLWSLQEQKRTVLEDSQQAQTALAKVIEAQLGDTIRSSNDILLHMGDLQVTQQLADLTKGPDFWQPFERNLPYSAQIVVIDAQGQVVAASQENLIEHNAAKESFFVAHREIRANPRLFISAPASYLGQQRSLVISRSIETRDNRWQGIAAILIPTATLEQMLEDYRIRPAQAVTLMHASGVIIARMPRATASTSGQPISGASLFAQHTNTGKVLSFHQFHSEVDDIDKLGTALSLSTGALRTDNPIIVEVSESTDTVLAAWKRMKMLLAFYAILILLAIWYGSASYLRRRDNESARALIDALLANPELVVVGIRENGRIALFNGAAAALTEYSPEEALGRNWITLLVPHDEQAQAHEQFHELLMAPEKFVQCESRFIAASGTERIIAWRNSIIADRRGKMCLSLGADITEVRQRENELQTQAQIDMLSTLSNRRHFMELGPRLLAQARRYHHPITLLMLDIDHFKRVNDTYGHAIGDLVIKSFSHICRTSLREEDLVGRIGGEEFAALLPHADAHAALNTADRIRKRFAASFVTTENGTPVHCTVSIGLATLKPDNETLEELLQQADAALYEAKHAGRDRIVIASP